MTNGTSDTSIALDNPQKPDTNKDSSCDSAKPSSADSNESPNTDNGNAAPPAPPPPTKRYHLAHNITLQHPTQALLPYLSHLNKTLLPVNYPTKFYTSMIQHPTRRHLCLLASHPTSTRPIGAICCEFISLPSPPAKEKDESGWVYIQTLGVLSPFRSYGVGTGMIDKVMEEAKELMEVKGAWAHVWEGNEEGLRWYVNRGFEVHQKVVPYYKKLTPSGAWIVVRKGNGMVRGREGNGGVLEELKERQEAGPSGASDESIKIQW
ncbi:hypothetical protein BJ508DRAFT_412134, partial [Ascobolus immersus RN42]